MLERRHSVQSRGLTGVPYSLSAVMTDDFSNFQPVTFDPVTITFD